MLDMHSIFTKRKTVHVHFHSKGSFILVQKRHRFHMGSPRIQFIVNFEQGQRSKKNSLSLSVNEP